MSGRMEVVLGPLLFNWPAARVADFYARIAEETPVDRVHLGEVVCGKRAPLLEPTLVEAAERLARAGKAVVWSTPALPATPRERKAARELAAAFDLVEINDVCALVDLPAETRFVAGPLLNVYNEAAAGELVAQGCVRLCANVELPLSAVAAIAQAHPALEIEIFAFGRLPLALSGRCYHARAHGLHKDSCRYVCDRDPDGMAVQTLEGAPFLAVNGIQTLSHGVQAAARPVTELRAAGVRALRLSPHACDMGRVIGAYRRFADEAIAPTELLAEIRAAGPPAELIDGYLRGQPGLLPAA